ncbi:Uncharacterised protein [Enterobacter hormaechei]|nr:Uncharacterised protein [Enterobacter hormaechei]CZV33171.1 Uncharacterised protein [Enterobacter hormaechei]CZX19644.1 Uncharacterised protein [Enterobacter hormaechei]CZX64482.1 Uncharacterised protein [Enterobacter hormaechei]CZY11784.1 Uncharacterised protein [Enterobacter hormaechei]
MYNTHGNALFFLSTYSGIHIKWPMFFEDIKYSHFIMKKEKPVLSVGYVVVSKIRFIIFICIQFTWSFSVSIIGSIYITDFLCL